VTGPRRDDGSAVVEFAVVVPLLVLLLLAVVQVGIALHVRATLQSAAAEAARVAAVSGGGPDLALRRIEQALSDSFADGVVESVTARSVRRAGLAVTEVEIRARLPLVGLLGPSVLVVDGHAMAEP
jgi:hypothetical protein